FDVHAEILVILRIAESIMLFQSVDLRFTDRWNLTLVSVKRSQCFRGRSLTANGPKCIDQIFRLWLLLGLRQIDIINAETLRELLPKILMIGGTRFFINQVRQNLFPARLIIALRMHG